MSNVFNDDFIDFIRQLNNHNVRYVLVGGYSVILNGYPRTTGDMDIWAERTKGNYKNLVTCFRQFGLPIEDFTEENFLNNDDIDVFTYGRPPVSIDLMNKIKGLEFDEAYDSSFLYPITNNCSVRVIHKNQLIKAKRASGRPKDIDDIQNLGGE